MSSQVQNLALVGASGNLGKPVLDALLGVNSNINITVITRQESTVTFPSAVTVKKGDYTSSAFLSSALQGIDILVLILGISALGDEQDRLIEAAAKAGVKYVLPTEFGSDTADERMLRAVPLLQHKKAVQARIADLGMKCISVITNPWFDFVCASVLIMWYLADRSIRACGLVSTVSTWLDGKLRFIRIVLASTQGRLRAMPQASRSCCFCRKIALPSTPMAMCTWAP